jgi:hypothetical protein
VTEGGILETLRLLIKSVDRLDTSVYQLERTIKELRSLLASELRANGKS